MGSRIENPYDIVGVYEDKSEGVDLGCKWWSPCESSLLFGPLGGGFLVCQGLYFVLAKASIERTTDVNNLPERH